MAQLPLFPLGTVLFPGAVLPLRVFEPRYVALLSDLLEEPAHARVFGVVSLQRGNEVGTEQSLELARTGTAAHITSLSRVAGGPPGGVFGLETRGGSRFRLDSYSAEDTPYYVGSVSWLLDDECDADTLHAAAADAGAAFDSFQRAVTGGTRPFDVPPEQLAYEMVHAIPLPLHDRQSILDADDPATRLRLLARLLRRESVLFGGLRLAPVERHAFGPPSRN